MDKRIVRGEIYFANLNPAMGSEQGGDRPVLILQNNIGNSFSSTVIVSAITGRHDKKPLQPSHVHLPTNFGLNRDSMVMLEQLRTIDNPGDTMLLTLCATCAKQFYNSHSHIIRRANPNQKVKDTCTYCSCRTGWDYIIANKQTGK